MPASTPLARGSPSGGCLAELLELEAQAGQRGAQLVGGVGDEVPLRR